MPHAVQTGNGSGEPYDQEQEEDTLLLLPTGTEYRPSSGPRTIAGDALSYHRILQRFFPVVRGGVARVASVTTTKGLALTITMLLVVWFVPFPSPFDVPSMRSVVEVPLDATWCLALSEPLAAVCLNSSRSLRVLQSHQCNEPRQRGHFSAYLWKNDCRAFAPCAWPALALQSRWQQRPSSMDDESIDELEHTGRSMWTWIHAPYGEQTVSEATDEHTRAAALSIRSNCSAASFAAPGDLSRAFHEHLHALTHPTPSECASARFLISDASTTGASVPTRTRGLVGSFTRCGTVAYTSMLPRDGYSRTTTARDTTDWTDVSSSKRPAERASCRRIGGTR